MFSDANVYINIIEKIASYRYGIGQEVLLKKMGTALQGKGGVEKLKALQDAGFTICFKPHLHKSKGIYYKVVDEYCLFYFHWLAPIKDTLLKNNLLDGYWDKTKAKAGWHSWAGLAFEAICYKHLPQISRALALSPTAIPNAWRYVPKKNDEPGAQIDLLFDRNDDSITICEIKYSDKPFIITREYAEKLKKKVEVFRQAIKTEKQIFIVMIAANGIKPNQYSNELISEVVTLDALFKA